jgi:hypothetical protein
MRKVKLTQENETGVSGQVKLGNADTANGTVILVKVNTMFHPKRRCTHERSLEPLSGVGVQTILGEVLQVTSERAQTLRAHRVTLVGLRIISHKP